jgi:hypothetical protein
MHQSPTGEADSRLATQEIPSLYINLTFILCIQALPWHVHPMLGNDSGISKYAIAIVG